MLSVLIPSFARPVLLRKALSSIRETSHSVGEIIVLSPALDDEYRSACAQYDARLVADGSRENGIRVKGLWQVLNSGIELARGPYVCWLNDDCTVMQGWDAAALSTFSRPDCAIVSLKTLHVGAGTEPIVIRTLYDIICANYGVILKSDGLRFDERFSWFHGDADIALQAEFIHCKRVYGTEELCVVHEHHRDQTRASNEADPRSRADWIYLNTKWRGYCRIGTTKIAGIPARLLNGVRALSALAFRAWEKIFLRGSHAS